MNYYWFNRQEILQKAKEKYSKEKAAQYYKQNKEAIKEKSRKRYKNLSQEENDKIKEYQISKLVKTIRNAGSKYDDYSISPKTRQIILHWVYELTKKDFFNESQN